MNRAPGLRAGAAGGVGRRRPLRAALAEGQALRDPGSGRRARLLRRRARASGGATRSPSSRDRVDPPRGDPAGGAAAGRDRDARSTPSSRSAATRRWSAASRPCSSTTRCASSSPRQSMLALYRSGRQGEALRDGAAVPQPAARGLRARAVGRDARSREPRSSRSAPSSRGSRRRRRPRRQRRPPGRADRDARARWRPPPLVGRERDLELAARLFESAASSRCSAPAASGKTRLAHRLATHRRAEFADGVRLVELAPVGDQSAVTAAVGDALDVQQRPNRSLADSIVEVLASQAAAARARQLRARARHHQRAGRADLALVPRTCRCWRRAASRSASRPKSCGRCRRCRCRPSADEPLARLAEVPAVQLFVERARAAQPDFELDDDNRRRGRRDLHPARRRAAGVGAGGGAHAVDEPGRAGRAAARALPRAGRVAARDRSAPPQRCATSCSGRTSC